MYMTSQPIQLSIYWVPDFAIKSSPSAASPLLLVSTLPIANLHPKYSTHWSLEDNPLFYSTDSTLEAIPAKAKRKGSCLTRFDFVTNQRLIRHTGNIFIYALQGRTSRCELPPFHSHSTDELWRTGEYIAAAIKSTPEGPVGVGKEE